MDKSTDNQNKNNENVDDIVDTGSQASTEATRESEDANLKRRRALIAAIAAVPVLLTLKSRSAFAADTPCSIVTSLNLEGNYSQHPGVTINNGDISRCDNPAH